MLELIEIFIVIKNAASIDNKFYLDDEGQWTPNIVDAKEFDKEFDGRMALKQKLDESTEDEFNIIYKIDGFLKTVYIR